MKLKRLIILPALLVWLFFSGQAAEAMTFKPQISIPGSPFTQGATTTISGSTETLGNYIKAIYNYALAIVGLLAAVVLMGAGVVWLTAAGNTERISQAKSWIMGSLTGMILALSSYLLLKTINPYLVDFKIQEIKSISAKDEGCCVSAKAQEKSFETDSLACYNTLVSGEEITAISDEDLESKYEGKMSKYLEGSLKFVPGGKLRFGSCWTLSESELEKCKGKGMDSDWGEVIYEDIPELEQRTKIYCFEETPYRGTLGSYGEPCGNDVGSRCTYTTLCVNKDHGGRDCGQGLECCEASAVVPTSDPAVACKDVANGGKCKDVSHACWCFIRNGETIMRVGDGNIGDPCGKKDNASCMNSCSDPYSWDGSYSTRSCNNSRCCY